MTGHAKPGHAKHFVIQREPSGEWHWILVAANARRIARSAHGYREKQECIRSARALSIAAYNADIYNAEDNAYEV